MRYVSAASTQTDPYRAGIEIGTGVRSPAPEVVLVFASISYESDFSDFFAGLRDSLEGLNPIVVGGTGDGIYETSIATNYGVCALGITSDGAVKWSAGFRRGVHEDSRGAAGGAARDAAGKIGGNPDFCLVFADGAKADGTAIVAGIRDVISIPFAGGLTGDDRKFTRSRVFHDFQEYDDAVVVLTGTGPVSFALSSASGWVPKGEAGVVQDCDGCIVRTISGTDARAFMTQQTGKPLGETDLGIVPLATYEPGDDKHFFLRTPSHIDEVSGEVTTFGSIDSGAKVKVCTATREEVLRGVSSAVAGLGLLSPGFVPSAAVVISCAGRKWLLDDSGTREMEVFFRALGTRLPLVGFPSFGEIGPFRQSDGSYTPTYFHNVTFVVLVLGA